METVTVHVLESYKDNDRYFVEGDILTLYNRQTEDKYFWTHYNGRFKILKENCRVLKRGNVPENVL